MDQTQQSKYYEVKLDDGTQGFAVQPIYNCPHYSDEQLQGLSKLLEEQEGAFFQEKCSDCGNQGENWVCLNCLKVFCSRYVKNHMVQHHDHEHHPVVLSFADFSFWCYECDNYITSVKIQGFQQFLSFLRFGSDQDDEKNIKDLINRLTNLKVKDDVAFTREQLIKGLKNKIYKKIVVLTGAGISVAAGIPDFRSPGIGLYSKLQQYNLPYPEAIFEIGFFKQQPLAFYQLANTFLDTLESKPVLAHKFIKKLQDENQLFINFTQNIDGLELDAGVKPEKLVQSHGHMRTTRCIECKSEHEYKKMKEWVKKMEVYKCETCKIGLVKPDIVFFGEQLPPEFFQNWKKINEGDLIVVMGTSLKVMPFAMLPSLVRDDVPIVVINRENVLYRKNSLFLQGDIEDVVKSLAHDLDWKL